MLKKLLKYDLQNVNKVLVIFYSLSLLFAINVLTFGTIKIDSSPSKRTTAATSINVNPFFFIASPILILAYIT